MEDTFNFHSDLSFIVYGHPDFEVKTSFITEISNSL